jgi:hypothetical protein
MSWALGAAMLFCGGVMALDGRADGKRESPDGGAALFVAGLIVFVSGVFVLLSAVRGAIAGGG